MRWRRAWPATDADDDDDDIQDVKVTRKNKQSYTHAGSAFGKRVTLTFDILPRTVCLVSTEIDVDSSRRFSFSAQIHRQTDTHTQSQVRLITLPTHQPPPALIMS